MSDNVFFRAAWGNVELWMSEVSTDEGRDLVIQKYTRGNLPSVQNRGNVVKSTRCTLLFDEIKGQKETGQERLLSLILLKEQGKAQLFCHPIHGTYLAEIGEFSHAVDSSGTITGSATFIATEEVGAVVVSPIGVSIDGSTASISATADEADSQLADVGLASDVPALARGASDVFDDASSTRAVLVQISNVSERVNQEIEALQMSADIALWPAMKAMVLLGDAVRVAGDAALGDTSSLMTIRIDQPTSLRRLSANIYGIDAQAGYDAAMELNDIPTPARIPTGIELRLPQPKTIRSAA